MSRSSEDLTKAANELQAKLEKLRREARRMKKLEEQQKAEEHRQQEIEEALEFVEFTKGIYYPDSEVTVYEFITTVRTTQQMTVFKKESCRPAWKRRFQRGS